MDFQTTSRKDDLTSVCYVLVYLFHESNLLNIDINSDNDTKTCYKLSLAAKKSQTLEQLCYGQSAPLKSFLTEIFSLKFEQEPDYNKLRAMLTDALGSDQMDVNESVGQEGDTMVEKFQCLFKA